MTDLQKIPGIGPRTKDQLMAAGITSVEQLAEASWKTLVDIPKWYTHVQRAKRFLSSSPRDKASSVASSLSNSVSVSNSTPSERWLITNHSWFEAEVSVPDPKTQEIREAIVYEFILEAYQRVCLLCAWTNDQSEPTISTMTYSPTLLAHFNVDLPLLSIDLPESDWAQLPHRATIDNVIWETNVIQGNKNE